MIHWESRDGERTLPLELPVLHSSLDLTLVKSLSLRNIAQDVDDDRISIISSDISMSLAI